MLHRRDASTSAQHCRQDHRHYNPSQPPHRDTGFQSASRIVFSTVPPDTNLVRDSRLPVRRFEQRLKYVLSLQQSNKSDVDAEAWLGTEVLTAGIGCLPVVDRAILVPGCLGVSVRRRKNARLTGSIPVAADTHYITTIRPLVSTAVDCRRFRSDSFLVYHSA